MKNDRVPLLKGDDVLIVPLHEAMNDQELKQFESRLLLKSSKETKIRNIVLDVSSIDSMDLYVARMLAGLVKKLAVMDFNSVVVGIKPEVAMTLMDMGVEFSELKTALNLQHGLRLLKRTAANQ